MPRRRRRSCDPSYGRDVRCTDGAPLRCRRATRRASGRSGGPDREPARPASHQPMARWFGERRRDRGAGRPSGAADRARRRDRRRRHPDGASRASRRRAADSPSSASTAGPKSGRGRRGRPAIAATPGLELHVGDGRSLPYADGSFDVAHASMVLHHLPPDEAVPPPPGDGSGRPGWAWSSTTSIGAGSDGSGHG